MTVNGVVNAVAARRSTEDENLSRLAWRTAWLSRVPPRKFPKTEAALLGGGTPKKRQSLKDQFTMAKLITHKMGGTA